MKGMVDVGLRGFDRPVNLLPGGCMVEICSTITIYEEKRERISRKTWTGDRFSGPS